MKNFPLAIAIAIAAIQYPHNASAQDNPDTESNAVNVYSFRQAFLVEPLFHRFQEKTGIHVNVLYAKKGLVERIALEGRASPADILLTTDVGQTIQAADSIAAELQSQKIRRNIPRRYRDPNNKWFALTRRLRVVMASEDRVSPQETSRLTYEKLAAEKWRGRICIRDGQNPYNLALFAAMLIHHGEEKTRDFLIKLKKNLARRPAGNDRAQIRAVAAGQCDLAVANNYYLGHMLAKPKDDPRHRAAQTVRVVLAQFAKGGTHENLSAMIMPRFAPNKENARRLMEFLSTAEAQNIYAESNFEYPVHRSVSPPDLLDEWGGVYPDRINFREMARQARQAALILDEIAFND